MPTTAPRVLIAAHLAFATCFGGAVSVAAVPPTPTACAEAGAFAELSRDLLSAETPLDGTGLVETARLAGISAMPLFAFRGSAEEGQRWLHDLQALHGETLRCGVASVLDKHAWVVGVQRASLSSDGDTVHYVVSAAHSDAVLIVRDGDDTVRRVPLDHARGRAQIPAAWSRPLVIQLVITDRTGPRPVAELWLGGAQRHAQAQAGPPFDWLNALRQQHHAKSLRPNRLIAREATAHAKRICAGAEVAHSHGPQGDPKSRLRQRGLKAHVVGEAIARADTRAEALASLAASPSHQAILTDDRFTDGAVGQASDEADGRVCLVALLAAWPSIVP